MKALLLALALLPPLAAYADPPSLHVFGARNPRHQLVVGGAKLDSTLSELAGHLNIVNPDAGVADLHSLSPAAKFRQR